MLVLHTQPGSARRARRWVSDRAVQAGAPATVLPLVELLASELVTNALVHGPTDGHVAVDTSSDGAAFRVEVSDECADLPVSRQADPADPGGRGVRLVETLASAWGVRMRGSSAKSVWFSVSFR